MSRESVIEAQQALDQAVREHAAARAELGRPEPGTPEATELARLNSAEAQAAEDHVIAVMDFEAGGGQQLEPEAGG